VKTRLSSERRAQRPRGIGESDTQRFTTRPLSVERSEPAGRLVFSDDIWRDLTRSLKLSRRESEILQAVFDDHKESLIANNLGISSHTVHTHLERLYRKLGVSSRVTLVSRVFVEYLYLQDGPRDRKFVSSQLLLARTRR
jgi:DNA-binding NarL/FixJ family response regulator